MSAEAVALIIPAFIAGIITFLAPCTLPLVPAYLGFISGTSAEALKNQRQKEKARVKIFLNGLFFMLGVAIVFVFFGALAGFLGQALAPFRVWGSRIGGIFVIIFGLYMIGVLRFAFLDALLGRSRKGALSVTPKQGSFVTSALLGASFATGWTPCVGPILLSVLVLASTSSTALQGAFLLFVFSLGLAVPFLFVAAGAGALFSSPRFLSFLPWVERIGGAFLVLLGIVLLTNSFSLLISYGYKLFEFINYDRLLDYL